MGLKEGESNYNHKKVILLRGFDMECENRFHFPYCKTGPKTYP